MLSGLLLAVALAAAAGAATPAVGWSPEAQEAIAEEAARLVPPDLYRQLARNRAAYVRGATDPFRTHPAADHVEGPGGAGNLAESLEKAVDQAVLAIELHRPFNEVAWRLGLVSHFLADANDPLAVDGRDPEEGRYLADFARYVDSARPRIRVVFYGFRSRPLERRHLPLLVEESLERSRRMYPLVGREYRRVGFAEGRRAFDDRSTAYAVASLSFSHAVTDVAEVLRYIWLTAGGADPRLDLPVRGRDLVRVATAAADASR